MRRRLCTVGGRHTSLYSIVEVMSLTDVDRLAAALLAVLQATDTAVSSFVSISARFRNL